MIKKHGFRQRVYTSPRLPCEISNLPDWRRIQVCVCVCIIMVKFQGEKWICACLSSLSTRARALLFYSTSHELLMTLRANCTHSFSMAPLHKICVWTQIRIIKRKAIMRDSDWLKLNLRLIYLICVQTQFYATGPMTHSHAKGSARPVH